ncbi:MAG: hypothetical protein E7J31_09675 [Clostridium sp.]|uniref:hypothetical protein n=1 Tax=Clostridium sp. TaxID=1506 RepID=UPI00290E9B10|nr:hypothetical protein [Clostridium sp.]MDU7948697.1 hypothetical protein [Clostridium sp.]
MLDKEYLRNKVVQGINIMPSECIVVREFKNHYSEKEGYIKVCKLTGIIYNNTNNKNISISLKDKGEIINENVKIFLVDYNESSKLVKATDYLFVSNKCYKIVDPRENLEIYFEMKLEEYSLILMDNLINENGNIYELMEASVEFMEFTK